MLKRMTLLAKRENLTTTAFREHWSGNHSQLALSLPGVCKYTQNRSEETLMTHPESGAFRADGIVELFFTDPESMKNAQASETGAVEIPNDELLFLKGWSLSIVDTDDPHDHVGTKVMVPITFSNADATKSHLEELATAARSAAATQVSFNTVTSSHSRPRLWSEPVTPTIIMVVWFDTQQQARAAFRANSELHRAITAVSSRASSYLCDPLAIK